MYQVVCLDDEPFVLEDLKKSIDWFGFNMEIVFATTDPFSAISYVKEHPVHLLLTDISMPQMSGIELIRRVKELNPSISILVLSAYDTFDFVRSAMQGGAENYLLKPLDPDELSESLSLIAEHLEHRNKMAENFGPAMLTFRSNFVENWCRNNLSEEEFLSRAELLGVNLQLDNYTVVMFYISPQYSDRMNLLFDSLLSIFVGKYICHFYFETPGCLMCILSSPKNFDVFCFKRQIEKLRPMLGFPFFVSVGSTVDNYDEVSSSYHIVKKFAFIKYTPLNFITCQNLRLSFPHQQIVERNFLEISPQEYLGSLDQLLKSATPEKRIFIQLAVINQGFTQLAPKMCSDLNPFPLPEGMVCDKTKTEQILPYLETFFNAVSARLAEDKAPPDTPKQYVNTIIREVHDFSNKDISLKTLAVKLDKHPSYLGSIFHQQTGYYFNDYLNEERLKYAAKLMEDYTLRLKDIYDMAGFSSQTYFNRLFKKHFNASPNAYRQKLREKNSE